MEQTGKPTHFDIEKALDVAQSIVDSDNIVGAMKFINECLPAYYREHRSPIIEKWRESVFRKIATIRDYSTGEDKPIAIENAISEFSGLVRFQRVQELVKAWNDQRRKPHIVEFGPGEYTLPLGLDQHGLDFSYKPLSISHKIPAHAFEMIKNHVSDVKDFHQPEIFVCFETIEHMFNPEDIYNYYCRENVNAEHILISTPHGALGGGWKRENAEMIAHVRDWTPKELFEFCTRYWGHMSWGLIDGPQMLMIGNRINA